MSEEECLESILKMPKESGLGSTLVQLWFKLNLSAQGVK